VQKVVLPWVRPVNRKMCIMPGQSKCSQIFYFRRNSTDTLCIEVKNSISRSIDQQPLPHV